MKMIITIGCSGSGKTTLSRRLMSVLNLDHVRCSADKFFETPNGGYDFDPSKLSEAHGACFREAVEALQRGQNVLVDNTNTTAAEVAPYIAMGQAYNADVRIVMADCQVDVCIARNTHNVPSNVISRQAKQCAELLANWPLFWPNVELVDTNS